MTSLLPPRASLLILLCYCIPGSAIQPEDPAPDGSSIGDRSGIHAAYEEGRHAVFAVEGGYLARNPGQRWSTRFDGRDFLIEPDGGDWTWGLGLESYGFDGNERVLDDPEAVSAEGQRVTYSWDALLDEWYINDRHGLEHGFTVHRRPPVGRGPAERPLTLTLAIRGPLRAEVRSGARDVHFSTAGGATVLTYTGLKVFAADGVELPARIERVDERLRLAIDEHDALYPLTIDPNVQGAYLKASNTDPGDRFSYSLSVSGDTAVIGAPFEDSAATGVNGDQGIGAPNAGAAYVLVRSGMTWSQQAYLKASNTDAQDAFGGAVAISGDTVIVGATNESSGAVGVGGDQSDNSEVSAGAAYVFVRSGTSWSQEAYLKASDTSAHHGFGRSVAVSGDTVVIGRGSAAYVFHRGGAGWSQQSYLTASNADPFDKFGHALAVSDNTVVIGAYKEDSSATGVNGDETDDSAPDAGAAYVFVRSGTNWTQEAYLKASNAESDDHFGYAVAVSGDTVVVGADEEDSSTVGVNGPQRNNYFPGAGAAYVFRRSGTTWRQEAYVKASNTGNYDRFGCAVSASEPWVVIGARGERSSATGVDGNQGDNSAVKAGAAYVFMRAGTRWFQYSYLKASNTERLDAFGQSVAISDQLVVVGAPDEDSSATGVGGDGQDNGDLDSGAAYTFGFQDDPPGTAFCSGALGIGTPCPCGNDNDGSIAYSGCANGAFPSGASLSCSGVASVSADTVVLRTTGLPPNDTGLYFQANNGVNGGSGFVFGDGLRCAGGGLIRLQIRTSDSSGMSSTTIPIAAKGGVAPGDLKRYQCWYRDNSGSQPCGVGVNDFNLSNGYKIVWLP